MPASRQPKDQEAGSIVVSGTGRVAVEPDVADLRLGVTVARPTVAAARADAADDDDGHPRGHRWRRGRPPRRPDHAPVGPAALRLPRRPGARPDRLRARQRRRGDRARPRHAWRRHRWRALSAGATSLDGLAFRLDDPAPVEREARLRAMAAARERADVLAEAGGLTIVGVSDILEGGASPPPGPRMKAERMLAAADASTPVEAGTTEVAVTVTVSYRARRRHGALDGRSQQLPPPRSVAYSSPSGVLGDGADRAVRLERRPSARADRRRSRVDRPDRARAVVAEEVPADERRARRHRGRPCRR